MADPVSFIHDLRWSDLPPEVQERTVLCLLDLCGVGLGGADLPAARIIAGHAQSQFGGTLRLPFHSGTASAAGVALVAGCTIDALDGHDGHNLTKGHVGCGSLAGILGLAQHCRVTKGEEVLTALALGYELGTRLGASLHASVPDYHTSGAWVAIAAAGIGARMMGLDQDTTRHALGIAEYHGPRSQMMRCIDAPTMVKDGSGWGAMTGVSAAVLAQAGFTGAPALLIERDTDWSSLGQNWAVMEQYFKPYPVCRWAQAPIEGVLALRRAHGLTSRDVARITVETFHESIRLATRRPVAADAAQYSTSFPCAVAMVQGDVRPQDLTGPALSEPEVLRLSDTMQFVENDAANAAFPAQRLARVTLELTDGTQHTSDWMQPRWDATAPPTKAELVDKYRTLASAAAPDRAKAIEAAVFALASGPFEPLLSLLCQSPSASTT